MREDLEKLIFTTEEIKSLTGIQIDIAKPIDSLKQGNFNLNIVFEKIGMFIFITLIFFFLEFFGVTVVNIGINLFNSVFFYLLLFIVGIFSLLNIFSFLTFVVFIIFIFSQNTLDNVSYNYLGTLNLIFIGSCSFFITIFSNDVKLDNHIKLNKPEYNNLLVIIKSVQKYNDKIKAIDINDQLLSVTSENSINIDERKKIINTYTMLKKDLIKLMKIERIIRENYEDIKKINKEEMLPENIFDSELDKLQKESIDLSLNISDAIKFSATLEQEMNQLKTDLKETLIDIN